MPERALVIIDIQNDYFPGGKMELEGADAAAAKAARAIAKFRDQRLPLIHVRHLSVRPGSTFFILGTAGAEIHEQVRPRQGEKEIEKNFPNSFRGTDLDQALKESGTKELVSVPARQVHAAFLAALNGFYAKVITTDEL